MRLLLVKVSSHRSVIYLSVILLFERLKRLGRLRKRRRHGMNMPYGPRFLDRCFSIAGLFIGIYDFWSRGIDRFNLFRSACAGAGTHEDILSGMSIHQ